MIMDQATAQSHLDRWIAADTATAAGKAYTIGNRQLTRNNAQEIRNQITYWQRIVNQFANYANNESRTAGVAVARFS